MLWCQGESDGDSHTEMTTYRKLFNSMLKTMLNAGIEKCFMIRIGNCNIEGQHSRYTELISEQTKIAKTTESVVMVTTDLAGMLARGMMKDSFHYFQDAYNEFGTYAGVNTALYVKDGKEPTMYDPESEQLYYSEKN